MGWGIDGLFLIIAQRIVFTLNVLVRDGEKGLGTGKRERKKEMEASMETRSTSLLS